MEEKCPTCRIDLTENLECQQCGFSALGPPVERSEVDAAGDDQEPENKEPFAEARPYDRGDDYPDDFERREESENRPEIEINLHSPANAPETEDKSLIEFTQPLPSLGREPHIPKFGREELNIHVQRLRDEHLILISCPDDDIALAAAHTLIEELNLPQPKRECLLNFDKSGTESSQPSIYNLIKDREPDEQIVVLADAATDRGKQFLQPIITAARPASIAIQDDLRRSGMYLICLTSSADLEDLLQSDEGSRRRRELMRFSCWRLPFLGRLLKLNHIEDAEKVEADLLDQRRRGWWSPDDSQFYFEVKNLIASDKLRDQIKDYEEKPPLGPIKDLFKGNDALLDTVLYIATFFPNLTAYEFNQLVPRLLDGAAKVPDDSLHLWRTVPDHVLKSGELATVPTREATTGVNFINHTLRETLREYLARDYRFFLENKFQQIQKLGLLFDRSPRISKSVRQLSLEMAISYPEYYGGNWLASLVIDFESSLDSTEPRAWAFIDETNAIRARKRFYQNITALLREMLLEPRLSEVMDEFMDQLLLRKHYASLLEIIRRLQFEPSFDQFKWLKQLFHRGNQQIRSQAAEYLYGHLKKSGVRVYQALESLESWLPGQDRQLDTPADYAVQIVSEYLKVTVLRFDKRYFGAWPSVCPLFAFKDPDEAAKKLSLLLRWVFHWGMAPLLKDRNRFLTYCFFILRGVGKKASLSRQDVEPGFRDPFDASTTGELLLQLIAQTTNAGQQTRLLEEWREQNETLLRQMGVLRYGSAAWSELMWKRELIVELAASYDQILNMKAVVQEEGDRYVDVQLS